MDSVRKYLKEFGFNDIDINLILDTYPICTLIEDTLLKHCTENNDYFLKNGYTKKEVIKMTKTLPQLYGYSMENIKQKIEDIMSLGYAKEEVIKMTKTLPQLYGYSIDNIKQKIEDMMSLGYTKEEIIKMTKSHPQLYNLTIENIKQKIEDIMSLGYIKEEVIKMTKLQPQLYSYGMENIKQKMEDIMSLGYTKEEVIKMTKTLPALYGYCIENIKQKIYYLKEIKLEFIVLEDAKQLMQSVDLTYARYEYFKNKNQQIDSNNYRLLFYDNKQFTKQFGIEKKELLETYSYKNREERRNII